MVKRSVKVKLKKKLLKTKPSKAVKITTKKTVKIEKYTLPQMKRMLGLSKQPAKRRYWQQEINKRKGMERKHIPLIVPKRKYTKIKDKFKPKTISAVETELAHIIHDNRRPVRDLLKKSLKKQFKKSIGRIARQQNKYGHMMEYEVVVMGEIDNQEVQVAGWTDSNKSMENLAKRYAEFNLQTGDMIDPSTLFTQIRDGLDVSPMWLAKIDRSAVITKVKISARMIKG